MHIAHYPINIVRYREGTLVAGLGGVKEEEENPPRQKLVSVLPEYRSWICGRSGPLGLRLAAPCAPAPCYWLPQVLAGWDSISWPWGDRGVLEVNRLRPGNSLVPVGPRPGAAAGVAPG